MSDNNKRNTIQKKVLKDIRSRYFFAVTLLASFAVLTFIVHRTINQQMNEDFKTINLSGRQRMLSQRIALLTLQYDEVGQREAIHKFQDGLNFLVKTRFVTPEYPRVYKIYKGSRGLEQLSREFIRLAESPEAFTLHEQEIFTRSQRILEKYEKATYLKTAISESEFKNKILLELSLLSFNLLILVLEIIYIFRPMARKVEDTFTDLNKIEEQSFLSSRLALIGEIASGIGHEIRNPLFVIRHYAGKITGSNTEEERNNLSDHIIKDTDRIGRIIQSLSTQAREASQDTFDNVPISSVIDDALEMFVPKIKYGNIEVKKDLKFDGAIFCRHAAISQVIANLISNAIDAVNEEDARNKQIRIESGKDENGIYLRIIDSGPGVSPEMSERIFESFITTKKMGKGTGLGLPISRKIMEEHQGTLLLNMGISSSCFELRFPA